MEQNNTGKEPSNKNKSDVLVQLTKAFCERFLPRSGDRTVDQMVQAAHSVKQNIVEGLTDGQTSQKQIIAEKDKEIALLKAKVASLERELDVLRQGGGCVPSEG